MTDDEKAYKKIKNIVKPTLIIWGENDLLITVENAYKFQKDLPNNSLFLLNNCGHVPMEESPKESLKPVLYLLENEN